MDGPYPSVLDFQSIWNLIFAGYTGSKNQVGNRIFLTLRILFCDEIGFANDFLWQMRTQFIYFCPYFQTIFLDVIGQGKHGHAAQAPILVDCLRVTAMKMMNVPIPSYVDLITALASSHLPLTVVQNLKMNMLCVYCILTLLSPTEIFISMNL